MKRFDPSDEARAETTANERLSAFTKGLWDALVPASGECASVQGELIRAHSRLESEYYRNGMGNYYCQDELGDALGDTFYGKLLFFVLDTLTENRNHALDDEEVAYFASVRGLAEPSWRARLRLGELMDRAEDADAPELSAAEQHELQELETADDGFPWEVFFARAERCIANWCIANPDLFDRQRQPIEEGGVRSVIHIFEPPPPPPPCPMCNGKGWLAPKDSTHFPEMCSCKKDARQPPPTR